LVVAASPAKSPLVVYELGMGGKCQMQYHPILQSLTVDYLARIGLVVGALNKMILMLVSHITAPLFTEQSPVSVLFIATVTVCLIGILIVVILVRLHP
jgi:hypothetical protein